MNSKETAEKRFGRRRRGKSFDFHSPYGLELKKITFSAKGRQLYVNVLKGAAFLYDLFITQPLNKRVLRESKSLNYIS